MTPLDLHPWGMVSTGQHRSSPTCPCPDLQHSAAGIRCITFSVEWQTCDDETKSFSYSNNYSAPLNISTV